MYERNLSQRQVHLTYSPKQYSLRNRDLFQCWIPLLTFLIYIISCFFQFTYASGSRYAHQNRGQIFESPHFFRQLLKRDVNKYEKAPDTKKIIKTCSNCCPIPTSEEFGPRKTRRATYLYYKTWFFDPSGIGYILELT